MIAANAIVVGAGIVGVCVAYNLAKRGCRVVLIEKEERASQGATLKSWAWINANGKLPHSYQQFNILAMKIWRECFSEHVDWCGSLIASNKPPAQEDPSYRTEFVRESDIPRLEPQLSCTGLKELGGVTVHHFPDEGLTEPERFVHYLLRLAEEMGVRTMFGVEVESVFHIENSIGENSATSDSVDGLGGRSGVRLRTRHAGLSCLRADVVVLANGTGVQHLAATAGWDVPMIDRPGRLVRTVPLPFRLRKIVVTPHVHLLQRPDGHMVIGESAERGGASSVAYAVKATDDGGHGDPAVVPPLEAADGAAEEAAYARQLLGRAAHLVPALAAADVEEVTTGYRPMPADGLPVIGFLPTSGPGRSCPARRPPLPRLRRAC